MNMDVFDGMTGKLTQAHIDKGVRDMCRECPVALSISDMLAEHKRAGDGIIVEVGVRQVRLHTKDLGAVKFDNSEIYGDYEVPFLVADLDDLLEQWVDDFDKGKRVPTGTICIRRDGFIEDIEGNKVQRWRCGIAVDDNTIAA